MICDFLTDIAARFNAQTYNLVTNNCNNFSDEFASFLVGQGIPVRISCSTEMQLFFSLACRPF
jgi:hypothetical protein